MKRQLLNIGDVFGGLTIIGAGQPASQYKMHYPCRCKCGKEVKILDANLRNGNTKSCGCWRREVVKEIPKQNIIHGKSKTPEHRVWVNMRHRQKDIYDPYRAKRVQIKVCKEWKYSFEKFLEDMGNRPGPDFYMSRENKYEGYNPTNCSWKKELPDPLARFKKYPGGNVGI
jgi:hypothetical protein